MLNLIWMTELHREANKSKYSRFSGRRIQVFFREWLDCEAWTRVRLPVQWDGGGKHRLEKASLELSLRRSCFLCSWSQLQWSSAVLKTGWDGSHKMLGWQKWNKLEIFPQRPNTLLPSWAGRGKQHFGVGWHPCSGEARETKGLVKPPEPRSAPKPLGTFSKARKKGQNNKEIRQWSSAVLDAVMTRMTPYIPIPRVSQDLKQPNSRIIQSLAEITFLYISCVLICQLNSEICLIGKNFVWYYVFGIKREVPVHV